jgi:biopolymer transport protein ExbD
MPAMSEINIIPLVDVVLVLLIIFMLTAQVTQYGLEVDVPKVTNVASTTIERPVITIAKDGEMRLNERTDVNIHTIGSEIRRTFPGVDEVYVRADGGLTWEVLAQVLDSMGKAKLKVSMVTQLNEERNNRSRGR